MKKGIHPVWNKDAKVVLNGKTIMTVGSTSEELSVEIWSGNHPFYTGQEMLVDSDNLVEKFNKKLEKSKTLGKRSRNRNEKRRNRKRTTVQDKETTLKDMIKGLN